jgi:hypothetical protein
MERSDGSSRPKIAAGGCSAAARTFGLELNSVASPVSEKERVTARMTHPGKSASHLCNDSGTGYPKTITVTMALNLPRRRSTPGHISMGQAGLTRSGNSMANAVFDTFNALSRRMFEAHVFLSLHNVRQKIEARIGKTCNSIVRETVEPLVLV